MEAGRKSHGGWKSHRSAIAATATITATAVVGTYAGGIARLGAMAAPPPWRRISPQKVKGYDLEGCFRSG